MSGTLRLGSRGSDLALAQAGIVAGLLGQRASIETDITVVKTTGDREQAVPAEQATWSSGAFVAELEQQLLDRSIDAAVHSYKDIATSLSPGTTIAAVLERGPLHDVLVFKSADGMARAREALDGSGRATGLVIGTSSPRREAQLRRAVGCRIRPVRGNVPTRLALLDDSTGTLDAVCLAAAGIQRLGIQPAHTIPLEIERFPTAAAQGAIAVQVLEDGPHREALSIIDHEATRHATDAERAVLSTIQAGCHTAIGAYAFTDTDGIRLHAEYHHERGHLFTSKRAGSDPIALGTAVGKEILEWLESDHLSG